MSGIDMIKGIEASFIVIATMIFGEHWILFISFGLLNFLDFFTGMAYAYTNKLISSNTGYLCLLKKIMNWILIFISFLIPTLFCDVGSIISIDLGISSIFSWYVLSLMIINEIISIIENLKNLGCQIPSFLTKGLEFAHKIIDEKGDLND